MKSKALFRILGFAFSVLPPLIATIDQFPLMTTAGRHSVLAILAIVLCCAPFFKQLKELLASPSAWMLWLSLFIVCTVLRSLIAEFYVISLLGTIGSVIGAFFFKLSKGVKEDG